MFKLVGGFFSCNFIIKAFTNQSARVLASQGLEETMPFLMHIVSYFNKNTCDFLKKSIIFTVQTTIFLERIEI